MIDIINKKCVKCNLKLPCFNYEDEEKALYCNGCKKCDMIDIRMNCITCNNKIPCFNYLNETQPL